jgi:hypothetical protein
VISLPTIDELAIAIIEVEIARQLKWRWLFGIASITALLLFGQELYRHASSLRTPLGTRRFSITLGFENHPGSP